MSIATRPSTSVSFVAPATDRIAALDFTKGALVFLMVVYHWLNYFVSPQGDFYRYLRFITPSFIFITGFLVSNVYLSKYSLADPRLPKRLVSRGLKILGIFVCLNLAISVLLQGHQSIVTLPPVFCVRNLLTLFVSGNTSVVGQGKAASFFILVPIGYLLLLSGGLTIGCRFYRYSFHLLCATLAVSIIMLKVRGLASAHLEFLTIGLLGVIAGNVSIHRINAFIKRRQLLLVCLYACYTLAITIWDVIYPLQIVGVCLSVMLMYLLGTHDNAHAGTYRTVVLLGNYSLFAYIAQVAILQLLHRSLRHLDLGSAASLLSFPAALGLTVLSVQVIDRARRMTPKVDRLYKSVFA
jgi:peptidoglycan/LPS O-acetylase OafA/YrhL